MTQAVVKAVWERIVARSKSTHNAYQQRMGTAAQTHATLSCGNLAHACAACTPDEKNIILAGSAPNIGIVTAYNDMLSAHQPFEKFPALIRAAAREAGGSAQVAGGVPAMCDGVTQGQDGMELSLFSRDVIAMAAAVALSHNTYSAAMFLGVCDKIVPGMVIAAGCFGHLPVAFTPAGPMPSGLPNADKARVREQYAAGKASRQELLDAETASYHTAGTCTFYGTANTNQMMLELMGLQLPGASFVNPNTPLRDALTRATVQQLCKNAKTGKGTAADILTPAAFVNAMVGVLATGGSTNHTIHLPAMAKACGILLTWEDFADLSRVTPLLCRLYPNGKADVNQFHAAGGMSFLTSELLSAGLLLDNVQTIVGEGLAAYTTEPYLAEDKITWRDGCRQTLDTDIIRPATTAFSPQGGLILVNGNLGEAVVKVSALPAGINKVVAPARVFESQNAMMQAFYDGKLNDDMVCVVRFQGPSANGMPELHKLTPLLAKLQDAGRQVALITDGRMSGASGKIPAAIHLTPEAANGGALAKLQDGDMICLDFTNGELNALVPPDEWQQRVAVTPDLSANASGCGRELFEWMRRQSAPPTEGGSVFFEPNEKHNKDN